MAHSENIELRLQKFEMKPLWGIVSGGMILLGLITAVLGFLNHNMERVWTSYLVGYFYFVCLALGGLFWIAINNLTKAGWSVSIRRLAEGVTAFLPAIVIGGLLLLLGLKDLYPWARPDLVEAQPVIAAKTAYLNPTFFAARILVFGFGVLLFRWVLVGNSLKQDQTGDPQLTEKNVGWSVAYVLFFAILFSLFSVDLLMSLMPTWYSTIFGIYAFSGMFQSFLALMAILVILVKNSGLAKGYVTEEHQHDVVKYLKGFTVFWAYIAFSQFMLIWYANIPEETEYYLLRSQGGWMGISVSLLFLRFIVPFLILLPRWVKRNDKWVVAIASLILLMQYVDIFWLVYPNFFDGQLVFGFYEVGIFLGFGGLFLWTVGRFFANKGLVAIKDPRMHEAVAHHVTY